MAFMFCSILIQVNIVTKVGIPISPSFRNATLNTVKTNKLSPVLVTKAIIQRPSNIAGSVIRKSSRLASNIVTFSHLQANKNEEDSKPILKFVGPRAE